MVDLGVLRGVRGEGDLGRDERHDLSGQDDREPLPVGDAPGVELGVEVRGSRAEALDRLRVDRVAVARVAGDALELCNELAGGGGERVLDGPDGVEHVGGEGGDHVGRHEVLGLGRLLPGELLHARLQALDAAGVANELHERLEGHGLALRERGAVVEEVGRVLLVHRCVMVVGGRRS